MKKIITRLFASVLCFIAFIFISDCRVSAVEYLYESGNVSHSYENVTVYSFKYDYISKFLGDNILDNDIDVSDYNFYSSSNLKIDYNHYDNWFPFTKDDDEVKVYKYNDNRKDFSSLFKSFVNVQGSYELKDQGIYKIVYLFDGSEKYSDYIYIYDNFHKMNVSFGDRYTKISPTLKLTFDLDMEDAYNLVINDYYYAFGKNDNNLKFTKINNMFSPGELSTVVNKLTKEITVNISEAIDGDNYLYFKCVRKHDGYEEVRKTSSVNITNRIQLLVGLVDNENNMLSGTQYYKKGDIVRFKLEFNAVVKIDDSLVYSFDNVNFVSLVNEEIENNNFNIECVLTDEVNFTKLYLKGNGSSSLHVNYKDNSLPVDVVENYHVVIDFISPIISLNASSDNKEIKSVHTISFNVKDINNYKVYYYAKVCENVVKKACLDLFDDDFSLIQSSEISEYSSDITFTSSNENKYNALVLTIFIKTIDKAGNETIEAFYNEEEYIVDNVIFGDDNPISFLEVYEESRVVGKSAFVQDITEHKIKNVRFSFSKEEDFKDCEYDSYKSYFLCSSISNMPFDLIVYVQVEDIYGNIEIFDYDYSYVPVINDKKIGNYMFYFDEELEEFYVEVYNSLDDYSKVISFDNNMVLEMDKLFGLDLSNALTNVSDKKIEIAVKKDDEYRVLHEAYSNITLPTMLEVYNVIRDSDEKYLKCAINGNVCNLEVYIMYSYTIFDKYAQTQKIKVIMKDESVKYSVQNFEIVNKINVNGEYADYGFEYFDTLNNKIDSKDVEEIVEIVFDGKVVSKIDTSKLGVYYITRKFSNSGIGSYPLIYLVNVVDEIAPSVSLKNQKAYKIKKGKPVTDIESWVIAKDNYDKKLDIKYSISPSLDINNAGEYVVSIWAVDSSGNESNVVTRTLIIENEGMKVSTYIVLACIALVSIFIMVIFIRLEKKRQKRGLTT